MSYRVMLIKRRLREWQREWCYRREGRPQGQSRVVFVAGVQRSGTNMIMDVLTRSAEARVFHEIDGRAFDAYQLRETTRLQSIHERTRTPIVVFKALLDAHRLDALYHSFEDVRLVWPWRAFEDMVNSHQKSFNASREHMDEIIAGKSGDDWRGRAITPEILDELHSVWRDDLSSADCAALFWYMRNRCVFSQALDQKSDCLIVRYEDIVTQPDVVTRCLCAHVGITYSRFLHDMVHARSIGKNSPPDLDPAVHDLCSGLEQRLRGVSVSL